MTKPAPNRALPLSLEGRYFHTFDDNGTIRYQGIVHEQVNDHTYLIQFFDWIVGESSELRLADIAEMHKWQFYEDAEHMKFWYEHRYPRGTLLGKQSQNTDCPT